jgi:hypothetical protein
MNLYIFEKASETAIRCLWIESDQDGCKSVANIMEMSFDGSKASMKNTIKCLYEMMFVGEQYVDIEKGYVVQAAGKDYDESLAGKARKQSSKDINVITEQLWSVII